MAKYSKELTGPFEGWVVDQANKVLYDSDGNHYHIDEIRALFYERQLHESLLGKNHNICSLKKRLEEKIADVTLPTITVDWGNGVERKYINPKWA